MFTEILAFILGSIITIVVLSLCKSCDDTHDKIVLLKDLWFKYENGEDVKKEIKTIINDL